ncbi:MAG: response regulator transcription factor [Planctomycetota bacterium]
MNTPTPAPAGVTIFLIDDQTMIRAAFRALLEQTKGFAVVGDASDAREGIERVRELEPDVVILDITMPGLSGLDAVAPLKRAAPRTRVLMASQHEGHQFVHDALHAGADGYLSKDSDPEELRMAIEAVLRGDSYLSPRVSGSLAKAMQRAGGTAAAGAGPLDVLTPREREVFQLIALGKANKEIAAELELSLGTVKKHRENLQRKLDCHSAAELARLAIREGLLTI